MTTQAAPIDRATIAAYTASRPTAYRKIYTSPRRAAENTRVQLIKNKFRPPYTGNRRNLTTSRVIECKCFTEKSRRIAIEDSGTAVSIARPAPL